MTANLTPDNKAIADYLHHTIGGHATVFTHSDQAEESFVSVMHVDKGFDPDHRVAATVGLSDYSIGLEVKGKPLGVEIVTVHRNDQTEGPDILATCAFNLINSGLTIRPGVMHPRVVELYRPDGDMKHILFAPPFVWPMPSQELADKTVAFLHAVPISDAEFEYAVKNGTDALETLLEQNEADAFDLDRRSVL